MTTYTQRVNYYGIPLLVEYEVEFDPPEEGFPNGTIRKCVPVDWQFDADACSDLGGVDRAMLAELFDEHEAVCDE